MAKTMGTKTILILSASFCKGGLIACASLIILMIDCNTEFLPIAVAFIFIGPSKRIVPPITISPIFLRTGALSPLIIFSSTHPVPKEICPSTGIAAPAFTKTKSSLRINLLSTSCILSFPILSNKIK